MHSDILAIMFKKQDLDVFEECFSGYLRKLNIIVSTLAITVFFPILFPHLHFFLMFICMLYSQYLITK